MSKLREKEKEKCQIQSTHYAGSSSFTQHETSQQKNKTSTVQIFKPRLLFSEASLSMLVECFNPWIKEQRLTLEVCLDWWYKVKCSEKEWNRLTSLITIPFYLIYFTLPYKSKYITCFLTRISYVCVCIVPWDCSTKSFFFLVCTRGNTPYSK